jgi:hypothetical protein
LREGKKKPLVTERPTKIRTALAAAPAGENDGACLSAGLFDNWIWKDARVDME